MKKVFTILFLTALFSAYLIGCDDNSTFEHLEIGKKYVLIDWPDSAYVSSLDSVLKAEPVKKDTAEKTSLTLNAFNAPSLALPGNAKNAKAEKPQAAHKASAEQSKPQKPFAERFATAISKWQSDPSNKSLYKNVTVNDGEDAIAVLVRTYGKDAKTLPRFYALSVLQSLNPGVSVEHPAAGQTIRVPKL